MNVQENINKIFIDNCNPKSSFLKYFHNKITKKKPIHKLKFA